MAGRRYLPCTRKFLVALTLSTTTACEFDDPQLKVYEASLTLTIEHIDVIDQISSEARIRLKLSNDSKETITACLGPSRTVSYQGSGTGGALMASVDHPGCMRAFTLGPARSMSWQEMLKIGSVGGGSKIEVNVEIVNPKQCGGWGCTATDVRSNAYVLP
jgi:hypothetical protein